MEEKNTAGQTRQTTGGRPAGSRAMSAAAMVLALIAALLFFVFYISIPLAATAIVLALLSRGESPLKGRAKISLIISAAAMAASALLTCYTVVTIRNNPTLRRELELMLDYYSDAYGLGSDYHLPGIFYKDGERPEREQETPEAPKQETETENMKEGQEPDTEDIPGSPDFPDDPEDLFPQGGQYVRFQEAVPGTFPGQTGGITL